MHSQYLDENDQKKGF
jgi:hypothetical protein